MDTLTLRPNGNVSVQLTPNAGTNYQCVDDAGAGDGDATHVGHTTSEVWKKDTYDFENHTTEDDSIKNHRIYAQHRRNGNYIQVAKGKLHIITHSVEYPGSELNLGLSYGLAYLDFPINPFTGVTWTWAEIDDITGGWSGWGASSYPYYDFPRATQVYIEVTHSLFPPTEVEATKGDHTDKVVVTWTKNPDADDYQVYRDGTPLGWLGDVDEYEDTGADAPTITPGSAVASDGEHTTKIALTLSSTLANNGTTHTYAVKAKDAAENESELSESDIGFIGHGDLTMQWQRSSGDADADYSNIAGATTWDYDDVAPPGGSPIIAERSKSISQGEFRNLVRLNIEAEVEEVGRYYKCVLDAIGCAQQTSAPDRGYLSDAAVGALRYQWQRLSDDTYIYAGGLTTNTVRKYLKSDLSYIGETAGFGGYIYGVYIDDTYIYVGGSTNQTVRKYLKSDLSYIGESAVLVLASVKYMETTYIFMLAATLSRK